ncbi:cytochrome P450 [Glonium stellatum]|uniref:Cytochrome P450 n=1 Tax=Glonium stellatum TaxID=574774 RepID=A0A8E2ENW4_9PEZI|nr:cytochrome P450 [Glonium stellatum]
MLLSGNSATSLIIWVVGASFLAYVVINRIALSIARRKFKEQYGCKPPQARYPLKDPFLGIDFMQENFRLGKQRQILLGAQRRFEKMGANTYTSKVQGLPTIVTKEPENIKTILSLKFKDYGLGNREQSFGPLLGKGIFNTDGERWAHSRHMIRPNFARDQVADIQAFERHIKWLFKAIPRDGSTVDLQELFFRFTIDSATEFLFGHSTNSLRLVNSGDTNSEDVSFATAFSLAQYDAIIRTRLGPLAVFRHDRKSNEAIRLCHEYVDKFVDDAVRYRESHDLEKDAPAEKYVFLHELAKATKDKRRIRDESLNVLLAGRDTTASLLSNMFFEIAKRPEVWAKLKAEIGELNGQIPTYEQLRNLKYLKWCLNESLRIHPVVPANSRLAIRDTVIPLGGGPEGKDPLFVPKGTLVAYSIWSMHRRKEFFGEDVEVFRPERWETLRPGWEYLPFNGGPRICLGQQYALTEASYVTTRILQEFATIESRDPNPWCEGITLTLASGNGTKVALTPA